jgi:hypothetical protein
MGLRRAERTVVATRGAILVGLLLLVPSAAFGQASSPPPESRHLFEYWFGPTLVLSGVDGTIAATSTVTLMNGAGTGRATQQLSLRTPHRLGVEGGFSVFPLRRIGLQARLNYASQVLSGSSGPYQLTLDYVTASPADGAPTPHRLTWSTCWPAPTGSSAELTVSLDGAVRWEARRRLSGTIGGGLTYFHVKGHADSLAFGQYTLVDDATVGPNPYAVSVSYGTATAFGVDVGGDIAVNVAGPLDVIFGTRYYHAGRVSPAVRVTGFANPAAAGLPSLNDVRASVVDIRASFDPSFTRIFLGVRIRS